MATVLAERFYRPACAGKKVEFLTLVSFVFLALVLSLVLLDRHGVSGRYAVRELSKVPSADMILAENTLRCRGIK